jgi:hypothetical protein
MNWLLTTTELGIRQTIDYDGWEKQLVEGQPLKPVGRLERRRNPSPTRGGGKASRSARPGPR